MATWQFNLSFVPAALADPGPISVDSKFCQIIENGYELAPLWQSGIDGSLLARHLTSKLGEPRNLYGSCLTWGSEIGNRIDTTTDRDQRLESVFIRIDASTDAETFVDFVSSLADTFNCLLFSSENGTVISSNFQSIIVAIRGSQAMRFCKDPHAFLNKIPPA